jgi:hypothetical protein
MNAKSEPNAVSIQDFTTAGEAVVTWVKPHHVVGNVRVDLRAPGSSDPSTADDIAVVNIPGHGLTAYCRPGDTSANYFIYVDESVTQPLTHLFLKLKDVKADKVQILARTSTNEQAGDLIEVTSDGTYTVKIHKGKIPAIIQVNVLSKTSHQAAHCLLVEVFGD